MRVFCVFFCFFRAKIWPAAAGTGELARDLRDQTPRRHCEAARRLIRCRVVRPWLRVWSRRSLASSPGPAAAGQILAPKKAKKHTKTPHKIKIKSKLNQK